MDTKALVSSGLRSFLKAINAFRVTLWNYPDDIIRRLNRFKPISYLLVSSILLFPVVSSVMAGYGNLFASKEKIFYEAYINTRSSDSDSTSSINGVVINPLRDTVSQIEKDLNSLIYLPLFSVDRDGKLSYKLAKSYSISEDRKSYTFVLRDDVYWYDVDKSDDTLPQKFTADDVVFTFNRSHVITEQKISVRKLDDYHVIFTIPQESPIFLETITLGIMPEYIWENVDESRFYLFVNEKPVGTGPYMVEEFKEDHILLVKNPNYYGASPNIDKIYMHLFPNDDVLIREIRRKKVTAILNPSDKVVEVIKQEYPEFIRYTQAIQRNTKVIFLNTFKVNPDSNTPVSQIMADAEIRKIISMSIDRDDMLAELAVTGEPSIGPIPTNSWAFDPNINYYTYNIPKAQSNLDLLGWKLGEDGFRRKDGTLLQITFSFFENKDNTQIAEYVKKSLEAVGFSIVLDPQDFNKFSTETAPRRNFEMLLFEIETDLDPDCYNYWHSTQVENPGKNLSEYSNGQVDMRLEAGRTTVDITRRKEIYSEFLSYFMDDMPAVYLYHPAIEYYVLSDIKNIDLTLATIATERFKTLVEWEL